MTPRNVARLVTPPRVERAEVRPLTPEQARAFLECCDRHQHQPLFVLAMATGLRQSELLGLSWPDVDLGAAAITVRAGLHRHDRGYIRTEPKTAASRRRLDLPAQAVAALHARLAQQKTDRLRVGPSWIGNPWDLVFTTEFGEPLSGFGVTRAFKRLLHEAGLPDQRFHDLRHGTATYLLVQGVPLKVVQTMLGHSTIHVTADTYAHVLPSLARDAADKVGELLWGAS
jgi:integrase